MLAETGAAPRFSDLDQTDPAQRLFETGKYGMFLNGSWYLNFLAEDTEAGRCDFRWGVVERPSNADGAAQNPMMLTPVCIYRDTTEPEVAWRFVRFVCSEGGANILAEQMVLPAYRSARTDEKVSLRAQDFGIDASLLLDGYDAPETLPSAQQRAIRQKIYALYEQVLLGLKRIDDFLPQAEQARADCREDSMCTNNTH